MKFLIPAVFAFLIMIPAAEAATAYATNNLHLRAGPDGQYPSVGIVRDGERVELLGCVDGEQWCEVETRDGEYGWVAAYYLRLASLTGRRITIIEEKAHGGLRIIIYNPHSYWDRHYRNKYFYKDRDKWLGKAPHYHDDDDHHGRPDKPKPRPAKVKEDPKYKAMEIPDKGKGKYNPNCPMGVSDC